MVLCTVRFIEKLSENDDDDLTVIVTSAKQISKADELIQINRVAASSLFGERKKPEHINLVAFILININCLKL